MLAHSKSHGFTLIELLVVIAIIAILAAILFPVFARAREKARQTTCTSNQRQIAASLQMYAQDHEETLPAITSVWKDIKVDPGVLICPSKGKSTPNGYGYNANIAEWSLGQFDDPTSVVLTADSDATNNLLISWSDQTKRHSNKVIESFVDGHVNTVDILRSLAMPSMDLMVGLPTSGSIANNAGGVWTRTPTTDDLNYWGHYANILTTDGKPTAPCIDLCGSDTDSNIFLNRSIGVIVPVTEWVLTGQVSFQGNDHPEIIAVLDNTGAQIIKFDRNGWPTMNAYFNNVAYFSEPAGNTYLSSWHPFTITVSNGKAFLEYADGRFIMEVPVLSGSNSTQPTTIQMNVGGDGYRRNMMIDSLKFGYLK